VSPWREQREEGCGIKKIQVIDLGEIAEAQRPQQTTVEAFRKPMKERKKGVQFDRESPVGSREQHVSADAAHFANQYSLLLTRSRMLHNRVAKACLEVVIR
jgi:hypothetical protein